MNNKVYLLILLIFVIGSQSFRLKDYNYLHYNILPHIHDSSFLLLEKKAFELGNIIVKYNLQDAISVGRLHKHFDISENEAVTMEIGNRALWNKIKTHHTKLIPIVLRLLSNDTSDWHPLQFADPNINTAQEKLNRVLCNEDFILEYSNKLKELNAIDELGINIFVSDIFKLQEREMLMEGTRADLREQIMVPMNKRHFSIFSNFRGVDEIMPELIMYKRYLLIRTYWSFKSSQNGHTIIDEGACVVCSRNSDHHFVPCPEDSCYKSKDGADPLHVAEIEDEHARQFVRSLYFYDKYLPGFDPHPKVQFLST